MNKTGEGQLNAVAHIAVTETFHVPIRTGIKVEVRIARDRRTMNNMDPETKATHIELERWGLETREALNGYPPVTLLGRLIEQGANGASQTGRPPVALSDEAARVDSCVARLCQIDQRVLRFYYQAQLSMYELSRKMSMRERQAQNVLRRARWRLQAYMAVVKG